MKRCITFVVLSVLFFGLNSYAYTLYWFTGAGIKKPAQQIAKMFNREHKNKVTIISGGSGQVLNEILETHKGDIYTLVDSLFLKKAERHGIVLEYSKILKLTPIFIVSSRASGKINSIYDLAKPGVRIAGGNPKAMCLGMTFKQIMEKLPLKLKDEITKNVVVRCLNVFQIVGYVKSGSVDAGIVLDKALVRGTHLKYISIPKRFDVHRYGYIVLIGYSKHENQARQLYNFILNHLNVYEKFGFKVVRQ